MKSVQRMAALALLSSAISLQGAGDGAILRFARTENALVLRYGLTKPSTDRQTVFLALGDRSPGGSAILPFGENAEGSTVFLPFRAQQLFLLRPGKNRQRLWQDWQWGPTADLPPAIQVEFSESEVSVTLPNEWLTERPQLQVAAYAKDFGSQSWGWFFGASDPTVAPGLGDKYLPRFLELDLSTPEKVSAKSRARLEAGERLRIYQLFVRLFGNTNETRRENGTLAENGVGKFADLNDAALASLRAHGLQPPLAHGRAAAGHRH